MLLSTARRLRDSTFWSLATKGSVAWNPSEPNVSEFKIGDYVVATVRRPGKSIYDLIGTSDMTTDNTYYERGINSSPLAT